MADVGLYKKYCNITSLFHGQVKQSQWKDAHGLHYRLRKLDENRVKNVKQKKDEGREIHYFFLITRSRKNLRH